MRQAKKNLWPFALRLRRFKTPLNISQFNSFATYSIVWGCMHAQIPVSKVRWTSAMYIEYTSERLPDEIKSGDVPFVDLDSSKYTEKQHKTP